MWVVVKYKFSELNLLKRNFSEVLGESPKFYVPKIKYQKLVKNKIKTFEKKSIWKTALKFLYDFKKEHINPNGIKNKMAGKRNKYSVSKNK